MDDRYYTVGEFAALCRVSQGTVYRGIDMGEILGVKLLGRVRIPKVWAHEYLDRIERERAEETAVDVPSGRGSRGGW